MVGRSKILSRFFRARTWVAVLIAMQLVFVIPQTSDEAEAITWDSPYIVASGSVLTPMAMVAEGDNVYCVYVQDIRGIYSVVMRWYNGDTWSSMLTVSAGTSTDANFPDIDVSNGIAHITYVDRTDRDADVLYRSYNGTHFSIIQQASDPRAGMDSLDPAIAADGSHVYIVWEEVTATDRDINYRYISDGRLGATGTLSTDIDDDWQLDPAVAADDGKAHVVWQDLKTGDANIFYRMWNGMSWDRERDLIGASDRMTQASPDVDAEGDDVYIVYQHYSSPSTVGINMATYLNGRWGTPTGVPAPAGNKYDPQIGVEAGHVALVYSNIATYQTTYFQHFDGHSWGTAEVMATGDLDHLYYPTGVDLLEGRAHMTILDQGMTSRVHRYYVGAIDEADPSAEVGKISPYWMAMDRISIPWSASDDYGLASVTVQYRYSEDKETWDRWTVVNTFDELSGTVETGFASFSAPDGDGFYEFKAYARDISGRSEAPSTDPEAEAALDQTSPTGSLLINDGDEYAIDSHVSLNLSYSDVMTDKNGSVGKSEYTVEVSNDGSSWTEITAPGNKHAWDLAEGEGGRTVHMRVTDAAGLVSSTITDRIIVDLTDPNMTVVINDGAEWTTSLDVMLNITYEEDGSGVAGIRIKGEAVGGDEPWDNPLDDMPFTLPEGEGTATVYYQVMDNAGRTSEVHTVTIGVDTVAPTGSIIMGGSDTLITERTVTLTLTADDATSGVAGIRVTNEAVGGDEPWDNKVDTLEWELTAGSGEKTVYYQVIDVAGHVSEVYSDTIVLDTDKPTGTIAIQGGGDKVMDPDIMLLLTYKDETSSIVGMRVSNEAIGGDEPWENPVETLEWELTAIDGEKTVYFQVQDATGQISPVYTLVLIMDTSNPYVESADPEDAAKDEKVDVNIVVRFSEAMNQTATSGATSMWYVDKDGNTVTVATNLSWSPDSKTMTIEPRSELKHSQEYTWKITADATDTAGNELYPTVQYTLTTEEGDDNGEEPDADEGFGLLMMMVVIIVAILALVVGSVWWMSKQPGPGLEDDEDEV